MKKSIWGILATSLLIVLFSFGSTSAQQTAPHESIPSWALEITAEGQEPYEIVIRGPIIDSTFSPRMMPWEPTPDHPRARGIRIESQSSEAGLKVTLFVELENERKLEVASYVLKENEIVSTEQVRAFGFLPLKLRFKQPNVKPPSPDVAPVVTSELKAIQLTGVFKDPRGEDYYLISITNVSSKNIIGMCFSTPNSNRKTGPINCARGLTHPMVRAGESYINMLGPGESGPGSVPGDPQPRRIVISTVNFDDGTFEGDVREAVIPEAFLLGKRLQLNRIVELLKAPDLDDRAHWLAWFNALTDEAYELKFDVDPELVSQLASKYPGISDEVREGIKPSYQAGLSGGKQELVGYVESLQKQLKATPETVDIKAWRNQTMQLIRDRLEAN